MLLLDRNGETYLGFTVPVGWRDYSFRLPSLEGDFVSMTVRDGRLVKLSVDGAKPAAGRRFVMRPEVLDGVDPSALGLKVVRRGNDRIFCCNE